MDGIICFDLEHSCEDLRMSIGPINEPLNLNESMHLWSELERVKRENEEL
jgi:hypothetical protein